MSSVCFKGHLTLQQACMSPEARQHESLHTGRPTPVCSGSIFVFVLVRSAPEHAGNISDLQVGEGLDLSSRYAVIVSFGVLLNGTALNEIAQRVGVNASSEVVLDTLVRCASTAMKS